jgi:DNA-binding CsgD family transcriptional regulator
MAMMTQQSNEYPKLDESYDVYSENIRDLSERRAGHGILHLTTSLRPLFQDSRAAQLCEEIKNMEGENCTGPLPLSLVKLCGEIKDLLQFRNHQKDWENFKVKRLMKAGHRHIFVSGIGLPEGIGAAEASILLTLDILTRRAKPSTEQAMQRFNLTNREISVAECLLKGWANKQIASTLKVTEQTVKEHIKHIMDKTDTTTRTGILMALSTE